MSAMFQSVSILSMFGKELRLIISETCGKKVAVFMQDS